MGANNLDDWWSWRRNKDERDREQDKQLVQHDKQLAILEERQRIAIANEEARHSKTPTIVISLVSLAITVLFFILQLVMAGAKP